MKFVYPWMLILVALVPVVGAFWVWLRARTERRLNGLVAPSLQRRLMPRNPGLFNLQATLLTGLFLVVFAAARPQLGHSNQKIEARSRNVVVALDVSRSMLAEDLQPNRLERAKADVADLIDSLEGDRCALVAFRRTGVLLCPLTTDHAFLRAALEGATPDSAPRGETDLGGAIKTALEALDPAADDHNAILLISDGGDLRGGALDAARAAAKRNVPIFTVGLGDPRKGSAIPDASGKGLQQYKGQGVTVKLEEKALVEIAKASGGRYVPLATAGTAETTLGAIYQKFIRQVAAKEQAEEEELRATERFGWFLVPGLLLMLLAGCFSRGRFAGRNSRTVVVASCLCLCFAVYGEEPADAPSTNILDVVEQTYVPPAEGQLSDREIWNKGYDAWKAGDFTNALSTLRGLTLSRTHGARAAEVVGTILHANRQAELAKVKDAAGVNAEGAALEPLRRAEKAAAESAGVLQLALRAQPDDPRVNRNFTRAVTGVQELRDELHVQEVLANAKGRNPQELMTEVAREALALLKAQETVLTNAAAVAVRESESLARRAEKLADALIPLKRQVLETVTNEQQAATIVGDVEATRDHTLRAAEQLADLSADAAESLSQAETAFHRYWKGMLDPPAALTEDLRAQTNAYLDVAQENGRDWQQEALDMTRVFRAKFPAWAQQKAQEIQQKIQQGNTNAVPFTKEAQDEITQLAAAVEAKQVQMVKAVLPPEQLDILAKLERIRELLPKDDGGGANNQQPQNNPQQNPDKNKDQPPDDPQKNDQDQQQDQQEQQQEQKEQKAQPEEPKDQKEIEELLRKAQERSDEHENEKKARMNKTPLAPNERDW